MIKAVLLDLDDTLIKSSTEDFFPTYLKRLGHHASTLAPPEQFVGQLMHSFGETLAQDEPTRPLYPRVMERFAGESGHALATLEPLFERFYNDQFVALRDWIEPRAESRELLHWLFDKGYAVIVATNPGLPQAAIFHRMRWGDVAPEDYDFDMITTLETMHFGKPRPEYYAEIILRLDVDPHEAIMVGDDWEADLVGAAEVGLHTFWVTENGGPPPDPDLPLDGFGPYPAFVDRVIHGWLDTLGDAPLGRSQQRSLAHRLAVAPAAVDAIRRPHPEVILECCPDEGEWSARDIVCHLRDYESQARERLERILRGDNPFLSANTNPWEYSSMYHKVAFEGALSVFAERRAQTVEWLRSLPDDACAAPHGTRSSGRPTSRRSSASSPSTTAHTCARCAAPSTTR